GSRISGETGPVAIIDARSGRTLSGNDYRRTIREQLSDSLVRIKRLGDFEDLDTNPETLNVGELERKVQEQLRHGE
ncbi:MAG TPA: hypothetical protein PKH39_03845, partial [Woeseiaceae bacterium]|nr:hypothetical protein [Woeseiaceae bacterium]